MADRKGIPVILLVLGLILISLACSASQAAPISSPTASQTPPGLRNLTDSERERSIQIAINTPEAKEQTSQGTPYAAELSWVGIVWEGSRAVGTWDMDYEVIEKGTPSNVPSSAVIYPRVNLLFGQPERLLIRVAVDLSAEKAVSVDMHPLKKLPGAPTVTYFPVQKPGYEALAYPSALAQGELILDNGYLRLKPSLVLDKTSRGLLIIWPPGSTWQIENDQVQVINPAGKSIARVGETLRVGGGEISAEIVAKYTGQAPPDGCESPYWLAAPGVYNAPPSTPPPGPPLTEEMKENPQLLPATAYANHHGITVDEAFNHLDIQNSFGEIAGKLDTELSTQEAGIYGGLWLQHGPEFKIVVAFTRDGEETLKKHYFEELMLFLPYLEVRTVKFSHAELREAQRQTAADLRDMDIPCDSATHIMENCVDIRVSESMRTRIEEAIRSGKLVVPESVRINYAGGLARPV